MNNGIFINTIHSNIHSAKQNVSKGGHSVRQHLAEHLPSCRIVRIGNSQGKIGRGIDRRLRGLKKGDRVVLEYGGNYCNYDWAAVAANPDGEHTPATGYGQFREIYTYALAKIRALGAEAILLSLPAMLPQRYFDHIVRNLNRDNILQWLGGDVCSLNRWREQYNDEIASLASQHHLPLIDISAAFLQRHHIEDCYTSDGMHPNTAGRMVISELVADWNAQQN